MKSKQTSNQLVPDTCKKYLFTILCIGYCYNSKPINVQIKHSLGHLQEFNPYFGWYKIYLRNKPAKVVINFVDLLENSLFVHVFGFWVITVASIIQDGVCIGISWMWLSRVGYLFACFLLQSLLPFSNSNFYINLVCLLCIE